MIAILGTGGHGRSIQENLKPYGQMCVFLCDRLPIGSKVNDTRVVGNSGTLYDKEFLKKYRIIIGVGDCKVRGELSRLVKKNGGKLAKAIHPSAIIQSYSTIGDGTVIMPYAIIGPNVRIGEYCIVNNRASVAHDSILHDGVSVSDCASFTTEVGEEAFIGLNVVVIPKTKIGARAIVGAGSVVTKEVLPDTTVAGVPAKLIKMSGTHGQPSNSTATIS